MHSFQPNSENASNHQNHEELTQKIDSDMRTKQLRHLQDFENSQEDNPRRRRPKFPLSQMDKSEPKIEKKKKKSPLRFAPFLVKTLQVTGSGGFYYGASFYIEKHNMIIACPKNNTIQFYNAATLLPLEERKIRGLESTVLQISYDAETDVCLFACMHGYIYAYNMSNHLLVKMPNFGTTHIPAIAFVNSAFFISSSYQTEQISIGNMQDGSLIHFDSKASDTSSFYKPEKGNLLLSGLANGSLKIYRTDRLMKLPTVCFVRGQEDVGAIVNIKNVKVNGKEYILTAETKGILRLWCLVKGKMRLLRVIKTEEAIFGVVYLENYKMIGVICGRDYVKFFSLPTGKFVCRYHFSQFTPRNVFLMKDKNSLGFADSEKNLINIVQLNPEVQIIEID